MRETPVFRSPRGRLVPELLVATLVAARAVCSDTTAFADGPAAGFTPSGETDGGMAVAGGDLVDTAGVGFHSQVRILLDCGFLARTKHPREELFDTANKRTHPQNSSMFRMICQIF